MQKNLLACLVLAMSVAACGAQQPPPNAAPAPRAEAPHSQAPAPAISVAPSAAAPAEAVPGGAEPPQARKFPPSDIPPPHARSAGDGDGRWAPYPAAQGAAKAPIFAVTKLHPHPASRFIEVTVVAIDLKAVSVHFMPGTEDLGGVKAPFAAGFVPAPERARLRAVFNGGFQPRHGRWGMQLGETTVVPPREEGCTLALYADGSVRLASWPALAAAAGPELRAFRQTPPCLLEDGAVHPDLLAGRDKAWKGQTPGIVTRRRSAVGLSEGGAVLFFAIGVEAPPRLLAEALGAAGARSAAELDINWNWTRFLVYERDDAGKPRVKATLAPGEYGKNTYLERASERDFFYVLERE